MCRLIITGVHGSGKGTQAKMLAAAFDIVHLNFGDIFRRYAHSHTKLASRIRPTIRAGGLLPDEIVKSFVQRRLDLLDSDRGFILDGFPRNGHQAAFFLKRYYADALIQIDVPDQIALNRILNRRLCAKCGRDYNLLYQRPAVSGVCNKCRGQLVTRDDDVTEATVLTRLHDYHRAAKEVLDLFRIKGVVLVVDGARAAPDVHDDIRERLQSAHSLSPRG
jgi:adenylate kinase